MSKEYQISKDDLTLSEKLLYWVIMPILCIGMFVCLIIFGIDKQEDIDSKFIAKVNATIENKELTEYQIEKTQHYLIVYMRNKDSLGFPIKSYSLNTFSLYIKSTDYDFWYEIKFIFEGD